MDKPGKLAHESVLTIHTWQAKRLIIENTLSTPDSAKQTYRVIGLEQYCLAATRLWHYARGDDPYAEMALLETERRLSNAQQLLEQVNQTVEQHLLNQLPGISIDIPHSDNPETLPLNSPQYAIAHAKMGARLIGHYDLLVRKLYICKSFGIITKKMHTRFQYKLTKSLRGVFCAPLLYKKLDVNRADIRNETEKGKEAITLLGPVPDAILNKTQETLYGPEPRTDKN